ncbi:MAG: hypothetical protein A3G08_00965 [Candidatus Magasanikbacteria bacterium RIFCSPLOWO2_12_FULL_47_9b]|nr:MAG: hypothetical protein A3G08_00965 [Candidatus Magasanikbacteria bacterium RIFCSPLOWO2_12_FULL_47_9b]
MAEEDKTKPKKEGSQTPEAENIVKRADRMRAEMATLFDHLKTLEEGSEDFGNELAGLDKRLRSFLDNAGTKLKDGEAEQIAIELESLETDYEEFRARLEHELRRNNTMEFLQFLETVFDKNGVTDRDVRGRVADFWVDVLGGLDDCLNGYPAAQRSSIQRAFVSRMRVLDEEVLLQTGDVSDTVNNILDVVQDELGITHEDTVVPEEGTISQSVVPLAEEAPVSPESSIADLLAKDEADLTDDERGRIISEGKRLGPPGVQAMAHMPDWAVPKREQLRRTLFRGETGKEKAATSPETGVIATAKEGETVSLGTHTFTVGEQIQYQYPKKLVPGEVVGKRADGAITFRVHLPRKDGTTYPQEIHIARADSPSWSKVTKRSVAPETHPLPFGADEENKPDFLSELAAEEEKRATALQPEEAEEKIAEATIVEDDGSADHVEGLEQLTPPSVPGESEQSGAVLATDDVKKETSVPPVETPAAESLPERPRGLGILGETTLGGSLGKGISRKKVHKDEPGEAPASGPEPRVPFEPGPTLYSLDDEPSGPLLIPDIKDTEKGAPSAVPAVVPTERTETEKWQEQKTQEYVDQVVEAAVKILTPDDKSIPLSSEALDILRALRAQLESDQRGEELVLGNPELEATKRVAQFLGAHKKAGRYFDTGPIAESELVDDEEPVTAEFADDEPPEAEVADDEVPGGTESAPAAVEPDQPPARPVESEPDLLEVSDALSATRGGGLDKRPVDVEPTPVAAEAGSMTYGALHDANREATAKFLDRIDKIGAVEVSKLSGIFNKGKRDLAVLRHAAQMGWHAALGVISRLESDPLKREKLFYRIFHYLDVEDVLRHAPKKATPEQLAELLLARADENSEPVIVEEKKDPEAYKKEYKQRFRAFLEETYPEIHGIDSRFDDGGAFDAAFDRLWTDRKIDPKNFDFYETIKTMEKEDEEFGKFSRHVWDQLVQEDVRDHIHQLLKDGGHVKEDDIDQFVQDRVQPALENLSENLGFLHEDVRNNPKEAAKGIMRDLGFAQEIGERDPARDAEDAWQKKMKDVDVDNAELQAYWTAFKEAVEKEAVGQIDNNDRRLHALELIFYSVNPKMEEKELKKMKPEARAKEGVKKIKEQYDLADLIYGTRDVVLFLIRKAIEPEPISDELHTAVVRQVDPYNTDNIIKKLIDGGRCKLDTPAEEVAKLVMVELHKDKIIPDDLSAKIDGSIQAYEEHVRTFDEWKERIVEATKERLYANFLALGYSEREARTQVDDLLHGALGGVIERSFSGGPSAMFPRGDVAYYEDILFKRTVATAGIPRADRSGTHLPTQEMAGRKKMIDIAHGMVNTGGEIEVELLAAIGQSKKMGFRPASREKVREYWEQVIDEFRKRVQDGFPSLVGREGYASNILKSSIAMDVLYKEIGDWLKDNPKWLTVELKQNPDPAVAAQKLWDDSELERKVNDAFQKAAAEAYAPAAKDEREPPSGEVEAGEVSDEKKELVGLELDVEDARATLALLYKKRRGLIGGKKAEPAFEQAKVDYDAARKAYLEKAEFEVQEIQAWMKEESRQLDTAISERLENKAFAKVQSAWRKLGDMNLSNFFESYTEKNKGGFWDKQWQQTSRFMKGAGKVVSVRTVLSTALVGAPLWFESVLQAGGFIATRTAMAGLGGGFGSRGLLDGVQEYSQRRFGKQGRVFTDEKDIVEYRATALNAKFNQDMAVLHARATAQEWEPAQYGKEKADMTKKYQKKCAKLEKKGGIRGILRRGFAGKDIMIDELGDTPATRLETLNDLLSVRRAKLQVDHKDPNKDEVYQDLYEKRDVLLQEVLVQNMAGGTSGTPEAAGGSPDATALDVAKYTSAYIEQENASLDISLRKIGKEKGFRWAKRLGSVVAGIAVGSYVQKFLEAKAYAQSMMQGRPTEAFQLSTSDLAKKSEDIQKIMDGTTKVEALEQQLADAHVHHVEIENQMAAVSPDSPAHAELMGKSLQAEQTVGGLQEEINITRQELARLAGWQQAADIQPADFADIPPEAPEVDWDAMNLESGVKEDLQGISHELPSLQKPEVLQEMFDHGQLPKGGGPEGRYIAIMRYLDDTLTGEEKAKFYSMIGYDPNVAKVDLDTHIGREAHRVSLRTGFMTRDGRYLKGVYWKDGVDQHYLPALDEKGRLTFHHNQVGGDRNLEVRYGRPMTKAELHGRPDVSQSMDAAKAGLSGPGKIRIIETSDGLGKNVKVISLDGITYEIGNNVSVVELLRDGTLNVTDAAGQVTHYAENPFQSITGGASSAVARGVGSAAESRAYGSAGIGGSVGDYQGGLEEIIVKCRPQPKLQKSKNCKKA